MTEGGFSKEEKKTMPFGWHRNHSRGEVNGSAYCFCLLEPFYYLKNIIRKPTESAMFINELVSIIAIQAIGTIGLWYSERTLLAEETTKPHAFLVRHGASCVILNFFKINQSCVFVVR